MTPALALPDVTVCCVDARHPRLGLFALDHCMARIDFGAAVLFTDQVRVGPTDARVRVVHAPIDSIAAYSAFMHRGLAAEIRTGHALVVQWDGLVRDPAAWDPEFLRWDYIGAPWPDQPDEHAVGNGGFSLRSQRLLEALLDPEVRIEHPEDLSICHRNRVLLEQRHGIRFAPLEVARRFAYERPEPTQATFGFHGLHNFQRELPADELAAFIEAMPAGLSRPKEAVDLCRALIDTGQWMSAAQLIDKRRASGLHGSRTLRLAARLWWAQRFSARRAPR